MEKIYMNPYDIKALPKPSLCSDGLNFKLNEVSMLICNKPIPKDEKVYFEVVVKSFTMNTQIKYIPLYLGIHRECSAGLIATECCIGSIFYKVGADYDIIEKYDGTPNGVHTAPIRLYYKMPITNDKIGCMIDPKANTISLYNNGNLMYSFSPTHFNLNTGTYFPCVMTYAAMNINGYVNFGKAGVKAKPNMSDCFSLFGYYYKSSINTDIGFTIETIKSSILKYNKADISFYFDNVSSYNKGDNVDLYFVSRNSVLSTDKLQYKIVYDKTITNYDDYGTLLASNKPIPYYTKTYIEFRFRNGTIEDDSCGIPIEIGLSNSQGTILSKSIMMRLLHKSQTQYTIKEVINRVPYENNVTNMNSSTTFSQEEIIGIGFDLQNQSINVYMNNVLMVTIKTNHFTIKESNDIFYFIMHDYGAFTGYGYGYVNFGATEFESIMPDGYMSLWKYYNHFYPIYIDTPPEISFNVTSIPYLTPFKAYLRYSFTVIGKDEETGEFTGVNLNRLMKTFNIVTDKTTHLVPYRSFKYLENLIRQNNHGFYDDTIQEETDTSYFSMPMDNKEIIFDVDVIPESTSYDVDITIKPVVPLNRDISVNFYIQKCEYAYIYWWVKVLGTNTRDIDVNMQVLGLKIADVTFNLDVPKLQAPTKEVDFDYNAIEGEFRFITISMIVAPDPIPTTDMNIDFDIIGKCDNQEISIDFTITS